MTGRDPVHDDDVGRLIRLAGPRPAPAAEREARVKAAVHARWLQALRRRRRIRIAWGAAMLAAAATVLIVGPLALRTMQGSGSPPEGLRVEATSGRVSVERDPAAADGPDARDLRENDVLEFGHTVDTGDPGRVALRLPDGVSIRLDSATRLHAADPRTFVLERGAVYVDSGGRESSGAPVIGTPFGSVRDIGTQYEVRLTEEGLRLRVREGTVALQHGDRVTNVPAAAEMSLDPQGAPAIRSVPVHGPAWDWVAAITTLPDQEGRTARAFLELVARERGWALRYADERTQRASGRIRLSGSLSRLTLDDALDAVLPACGMTWTAEEGILRVELAEADR